jgi:hypothetical protein
MGVNGINLAAHDKAAITYKNSKGTIHDSNKRIEAGKGASNYTPLRLTAATLLIPCSPVF